MKANEACGSSRAAQRETNEEMQARIARLRTRIAELRVQAVPLREIAELVAAEGLISPPNEHAGYALVHHHWKQMMKEARGREVIIEAERELYVARLERALQKATRAPMASTTTAIAH